MATCTKSWNWNSDLESWAATVGTMDTVARSTTYYSSASGALYGWTNNTSPSAGSFDLTSITWETLGVPSGATVTAVEVSTVKTQGGLAGWSRANYFRFDLELTCGANTHDLFLRSVADDGSWLTHTQASKNGATMSQVSGLSYASNAAISIKLKVEADCNVGSGGQVDGGLDDLSIVVTYINTYSLACATGELTLTGSATGIKATRKLTCATKAYTLTGAAATLTYSGGTPDDHPLECAAGELTLTGAAAGIKAGRKLTCATGALTLTGAAATLKVGRKLACATGALTLTGNAAAFPVTRKFTCATGSLVLTGPDVVLDYGTPHRTLTCDAGTLTLTGNAAGLKAARKLVCATGELVLTGAAATPKASRKLTCTAGAMTLAGAAASLLVTRKLACAGGSLTLTGNAAAITAARKLTAATGELTLTGLAVTLTYTEGEGETYSLVCAAGELVLTGANVGLSFGEAAHVYQGVPVNRRPGLSASAPKCRSGAMNRPRAGMARRRRH